MCSTTASVAQEDELCHFWHTGQHACGTETPSVRLGEMLKCIYLEGKGVPRGTAAENTLWALPAMTFTHPSLPLSGDRVHLPPPIDPSIPCGPLPQSYGCRPQGHLWPKVMGLFGCPARDFQTWPLFQSPSKTLCCTAPALLARAPPGLAHKHHLHPPSWHTAAPR